jgi:hypothetical protein
MAFFTFTDFSQYQKPSCGLDRNDAALPEYSCVLTDYSRVLATPFEPAALA